MDKQNYFMGLRTMDDEEIKRDFDVSITKVKFDSPHHASVTFEHDLDGVTQKIRQQWLDQWNDSLK